MKTLTIWRAYTLAIADAVDYDDTASAFYKKRLRQIRLFWNAVDDSIRDSDSAKEILSRILDGEKLKDILGEYENG